MGNMIHSLRKAGMSLSAKILMALFGSVALVMAVVILISSSTRQSK